MPGTYVFKPVEANLTHNTELLGKMSPYCSFVVGNERLSSGVSNKGGKHPIWNDTVVVPAQGQQNMIVQVMDKDKITQDDIIGDFMVDLGEVQSRGQVSRWYPLTYKNKPAGEILIESYYQPQSGSGYGQSTLAGQGGLYQQQGQYVSGQSSYIPQGGMVASTNTSYLSQPGHVQQGGIIAGQSSPSQGQYGYTQQSVLTGQSSPSQAQYGYAQQNVLAGQASPSQVQHGYAQQSQYELLSKPNMELLSKVNMDLLNRTRASMDIPNRAAS